MPNRVGQQLGNYRLLRQLGKGGFGQVYLGEQVYLKTHAAIKLLLEDSGEGKQAEAFQAAFLQEARRIATLKHPHILRVLDFGMEASTPYLVMEYAAHGTLLDRHLHGSRVPEDQVVSYTIPLAQALHYAHEARLIHRDIKPANVLLDEQDTVLLSDFGIATVAHRTSSLRTGAFAGTAAYMAPEQLQGKPVPASDQYALAIMVYEWLCGQLPYQGDPISIGMQHLTAPLPSLRRHYPTLSPSIEAVVHQAMAKDPKQRFATVLDFADALERAAQPSIAPTLDARPQFQEERIPSKLPPTILATPARLAPLLNTPTVRSLPPTRTAIPTPSFPPTPTKKGHSITYITMITLVALIIVLGGMSGIYFFHRTSGNLGGTLATQPPTLPRAGSVLYQENGSDNWRGWTGSPDWKIGNGQLLNDGSNNTLVVPPTITAPYQVKGTANYAVETKISIQRQYQNTNLLNAFAIIVRGSTNGGVWQGYSVNIIINGVDSSGSKIYIQNANPDFNTANLAQAPFICGTTVHTYRVEVKGNDIKVFIDGYLKVEAIDNEFPTGGQVGLDDFNNQLTVNSFDIIAF